MTTEEAIGSINYGLNMETSDKTPFGQLTIVKTDALRVALAALRARQEAEKNEPLTLEELREMALICEGIYVARVDGSPVFRNQTYCAAVLDISPAFGSEAMHFHAIYGDRLTMWEDEYGKTWLAYRHKPKEETK